MAEGMRAAKLHGGCGRHGHRGGRRRRRGGSCAAAQLLLGLLVLTVAGTTQAQYEIDAWSADLTMELSNQSINGYDRDGVAAGSLTDAEFTYGGTTYTIRRVGDISTRGSLVLRLRPAMGSSVRRDLEYLEFGGRRYTFADATHTTVGSGDDEASEFVWKSGFVSTSSLRSTSDSSTNVRVNLVAQGNLPTLGSNEQVRLRTIMTVNYNWCHQDQLVGRPGCFYQGFYDRASIGSLRRTYFRFGTADKGAGIQMLGIHRPSENSGTRTLIFEVYLGELIADDFNEDGTGFVNALRSDGRWNLYIGNRKYAVHDAEFHGYLLGTNGSDGSDLPARRYWWTETSSTRMPSLSPSGRQVQVVLTRRPISSSATVAEPLTVQLDGVPATHNGTPFTIEAAFSDTIAATPAKLRDAFTVTGGKVTSVAIKDDGSEVYNGDKVWIVTVAPSGTGRVSLLLLPTANCTDTGAICTADGRALSVGAAAPVAFAPWLSVADAEATEEENATMDFDVTLVPAVNETVTVDYATSDGTATAPADYTQTSGTLTFAANETSKTISVPVVDDNVPDNNEKFTLTLSNPTVAALADASATGTISNTETDTDIQLTATIGNVPASHDGPGNIFTFGLNFSEDVAGLSYATLRDAFTVTDGEVVGAKRIDKDGNRNWLIKVEPAGEATVNATLAAGAVQTGGGRLLSTAVSASVPPSALTARWFSAPIVGHNGKGRFNVEIKFSWPVAVSAETMRDDVLTVTNGTVKRAERGDGSNARWWRIRIEPSSHRDVTIELPATASCDDTGAVCTAAGRMLTQGLSPGVIWGPRALSVSDATVTEGDGATLDFELAINRIPHDTLTVTYETRNGTATAGSDYTATSGSLTFEDDQTRKSVSIPVLNDDVGESGETMTLVVTELRGSHSFLLDAEGEGTIIDDDEADQPMLSVADAHGSEGGTASFEVTLNPAATGMVTAYYSTANGTATAGTDYTGRWGSLTFAAGETSKTVAVELLDDDQEEADETFSLELMTATGAGYRDPSGTGTIEDDDASAVPTVAFDDETLPVTHDWSTMFTVDLAFSEEIADLGYAWVRDTLVTATNATVKNARRADAPSNLAWELDIEPSGSADVTLVVAAGLTLPDGRTLTGGDTATVRARLAPTATFDDDTLPSEHDGSTVFTVDLAFSEEIADIGYAWVRDTLITVTNGTVENARRTDAPSNLAWEVDIEPNGSADVTLAVAEAQTLPDGRTLTGGDTVTVQGPAPQSASSKGTVVTLIWASPRDGFGTSLGSDWEVTVNGAPREVTSVDIEGPRAVLELSAPTALEDAVAVGYVGSAMHPLADETGRVHSAPWYGLEVENTTEVARVRTSAAFIRSMRAVDPDAAPAENEAVMKASGQGLTNVQGFSRLKALERLDLSDNHVVDLSPLARLTSLKWLDLSGNRVVDLSPLAELTSLERLDLSGNAVVDLSPLARLTSLERLNLSGNRVVDISPLVGLDRIARLDLADNRIADVWPLADLRRLKVLRLDRNAVDDASPFAHLTGLENLGLADNRVVDVTVLQALPQLRRLDLRNNPVSDLSPVRNVGALMSLVRPNELVARPRRLAD